MSDREKLIDLLEKGYSFSEEECHKHQSDCECCIWYDGSHLCGYVAISDYLIKNGVTVQKWIPVSDMLPRFMQIVLVTDGKHVYKAALNTKNKWIGDYINSMTFKVTHWMPMPQPPKGEVKKS